MRGLASTQYYDVDVSNLFVLDPEENDVQNMLQVISVELNRNKLSNTVKPSFHLVVSCRWHDKTSG